MTSDQRNEYRDILRSFIRVYKSEPCLWKQKSKQYRNKQKKAAAYNKLVTILKDIDPSSDRSRVVHKINALRSNFRKERKKVEQSLKSRVGSVYVPNLWYYTELNFLTENPATYIDEAQAHSQSTDEEQEESMVNIKYEESLNETGNTDDESPEVAITQCNIVATSKMRSDYVYDRDRDVLSEAEYTQNDDSRFELFGKTVAMKIRHLPKMQRLLAEKIINDTLFEAEMGNLTIKHKLILQE